jgi:uncharacterized surface protein with fasciclin (FAS1) repeats
VSKCQGYSSCEVERTNAWGTSIFTLPASLSATVQATGESTFASLANSANLTDAFDNIPYSTFFIPSDEAFANANASPSAATANLLSGHVIPNFVGYLPSLVNGSTLTTQAGSSVTVTVQGNNYYINDALIVSSNLILENGVAHVIDQVCLFLLTGRCFPTSIETVTDRSHAVRCRSFLHLPRFSKALRLP